MTGHVRRRGKKWAVVVDLPHAEGQPRRQKWHSGFATKRAAEAQLTEILGRLQKGDYVEPSRQTLAAFLEEYLAAARTTLRPATWEGYRASLAAYVTPTLGDVPLQGVTPSALTALYAELLAHGRANRPGPLSARTVRMTHSIIRKALGEAVRWGYLARNPADLATPPRQQLQEMHTWSADQLRAFLEHVEGDRYYPIYLLAATTGLRRGELLGLRWQDLDLDGGRVSITQTLGTIANRMVFSPPKTASSRRSVTLDKRTVAALRAHRKTSLAERLAFGAGYPDTDLVFVDGEGLPVHPRRFSAYYFQQHVKAAGLPKIRFHDLRHTHATLALQAGLHPKVVSERLGHSSIAVTMDRYSHVMPAMEAEAAEKIAQVLFG